MGWGQNHVGMEHHVGMEYGHAYSSPHHVSLTRPVHHLLDPQPFFSDLFNTSFPRFEAAAVTSPVACHRPRVLGSGAVFYQGCNPHDTELVFQSPKATKSCFMRTGYGTKFLMYFLYYFAKKGDFSGKLRFHAAG